MSDPFGFESLDLDWLRNKPGAKWARYGTPYAAWIADMDFPPPPCVADALRRVIAEGDLGYPEWRHLTGGSGASDAFVERCARKFGWSVDLAHTRELNDVMHGIHMVVHLCTEPGDGIVVHTPCYPPFLRTIEDGTCHLVRVPAFRDTQSSTGWAYDHAALDRELSHGRARILLLCNPQNPTGHVFSERELTDLADIAERHDLLVIADEIHADLVYPGHVHRPIATLIPERTITIHAVSKAFNLAGMRHAVAHVGPAWLRERIASFPDHLFGSANLMGAVATEAAWREGDEWLAAMVAHLDRQRDLVGDLLAEHLPDVVYTPPAATYLAWLDCSALGWGDDPAEEFARRGVRLSEGPTFGEEGRGFARLNFSTSSAVLRATVAAMATQRTASSKP